MGDYVCRAQLENTAVQDHGLPEKSSCPQNFAVALLTAFGSTYLSEQLFSHMKALFSSLHSPIPTPWKPISNTCLVAKYNPQIMEISKGKEGQGSHWLIYLFVVHKVGLHT